MTTNYNTVTTTTKNGQHFTTNKIILLHTIIIVTSVTLYIKSLTIVTVVTGY